MKKDKRMIQYFSTYHRDTPHSNQFDNPSKIIIPAIKYGKKITFAVGFVGEIGLNVLESLAKNSTNQNICHITLILGMAQNGLTESQVNHLERLENNHQVQVLIQENFHDKIVIIPEDKYVMVGSANLNALLNPLSQEVCSETMMGFFEEDSPVVYKI